MFIPARDAGLDALHEFVPHAGADYRRDRNHDQGPSRTNVSGLSPYIRHRLVTEQEVVDAILERHSPQAAEKFVQEVFWRTYWKGWLEQRPEVWRRYRREVRVMLGDDLPAGCTDAVSGRSGIEAMDAWARELVETGYLHNHVRMWFASIWVFTLGLPWQLGADFFHRNLLDGDAASNTLSWRWVAGLQTRGKTYLATTENIARYTDGRFAPTGLATTARPLDEEPFPPAAPVTPAEDVAAAVGSHVGLLLHEEDLEPVSLLAPLGRAAPSLTATAVSADAESRSPGAVSPLVEEFTAGAAADAAARTVDADGRAATLLGGGPGPVVDWAIEERLDTVLVPVAPVGPVQERLDTLRPVLAEHDVALVTVRRPWDSRAWPHASRGFFPFRKQIPRLLRAR